MSTLKIIVRRYPGVLPLSVLCLAAMEVMVYSRGTPWAFRFTIVASVSFVLAGAVGGAHKNGFGRLMFVGLVLCCAGDLLGVYDFIWGAVAFLAAHVAFIMAFLVQRIHWRSLIPAMICVVLVNIPICFWLLPHVPAAQLGLVLPYLLVISAMVVLSFGVRMPGGKTLLTAGAVIFFISDIFVARWRYVAPSGINAYFCYPLYYTACVLLALSIAGRNAGSPVVSHTENQ